MKPNFTLILLAYNDDRTVEQALDSIINQGIFKQNIPFEFIVIPNGCTDTTEQRIDSFLDKNKAVFDKISVKKISIKEGHRNKALNAGVSESKSDIIMYMNADCTISINTLSRIYESFGEDKNIQVIGPNDLPVLDKIDKDSLLYKMFEGEEILWKIKAKYLPIGRFIAFRKNLIDKFPEDIHSEDIWIDLISVQKHGLESVKVLMDANVYWTPPDNWPSYISLYSRYVHGPNQLFEKYPDVEPTFKEVISLTNTLSRDELAKKVVGELISRGLSQQEAVDYAQSYKTVRDIIKENEKFMASEMIKNNGTWETDR